jgi:hypothetical protein
LTFENPASEEHLSFAQHNISKSFQLVLDSEIIGGRIGIFQVASHPKSLTRLQCQWNTVARGQDRRISAE